MPVTQKIPPAYSPATDFANPTGTKPIAVTRVPVNIGNAVEEYAKVAAFKRSQPDSILTTIIMMVVKMESGWDRLNAATFAYSSTAFPMLTGTLVTAIGFVPVGFAKSVAGEYAGGIFWVTGIALVVSWIVAVVFTP